MQINVEDQTFEADVDLAERVLLHVLAHPQQHVQESWVDEWFHDSARGEADSVCLTSACLAGWTVMLGSGQQAVVDLVRADRESFDTGSDSVWVQAAARLLGVPTSSAAGPALDKLMWILHTIDEGVALKEFADYFGLDLEALSQRAQVSA